ncbi:protein orai-2-like isoform X2 [Coccinella septempunctata]|uniref:protein orai-2-like isoform X2 n=1 Tax=Coccinella septempunctata TaxID=41139 RepID=UPI001D081CBF|nr:protein orai-2-like isoform X2 [Coccinella septempunctata]
MPSHLKFYQDQSTQVSFPSPLTKKPRTIRRFLTSEDIYHRNRPTHMSNFTNFNSKQQTLPRPKSLNFTPETPRSAKIYSIIDSPVSTGQEGTNLAQTKEKQNVYSCSSSLVSNPRNGYKTGSTQKLIHQQIDEESSGCSCRCTCKASLEMTSPQMVHFNEKQSLSWRRLHMSRAKLKATSATSELLSGFAMVAMVELQINEPTGVPEWLFVIFAVCTTVLVSVHIFALMISTYILPNIDAIAKMEICEWVSESPHERMRGFIEIAWAFSTVLGLFLFLLEVAILCWVKFWDYSFPAAIAATVVVIPVLIIFVLFTVHFYHSLVVLKCNSSSNDMVQLEDMKRRLDNISNPV